MKVRLPSLCLLLALAAAQPSPAQTTENEAKFLDQVRREARDHSPAGEYAFYLTDVHKLGSAVRRRSAKLPNGPSKLCARPVWTTSGRSPQLRRVDGTGLGISALRSAAA
jgi:hypothetical protein